MVRISVLMPNYNGEDFLKESISSILKQTYKDFEFVIIDDCSTDKSWKIIKEFAKNNKKIKCFRNKNNQGIVKTRNKLLSLASEQSEFIAIMDSDDMSMSKRFEKQISYLDKHQKVGLLGSNIIIIDDNSETVGKRKYDEHIKKNDSSIFIKSPFAQPSIMIRKNVLDKNKYSENFEVAEDWDLWMRSLKKTEGANLQQELLKYRITKTQSKNTRLKKTIINSLKVRYTHMQFKHYFMPRIIIRMIGEAVLLILPNSMVSWLFKKIEIRKNER